MDFIETGWALLPPIIAILIALKTKEVYLSLFFGVLSGALLLSNFNILNTINIVFDTIIGSLGDTWNIGILLFLVFLGIIVTLMTKAGGSRAYGIWAKEKINSQLGSLFATFLLGVLIFVDDYFNCLTVGSVMREVTDEFNVSRAKLAYIIDSTAAPICIIAPISSWAAAVSGYTSGDGFSLFLQTIPFNLYALLTIIMVAYVIKKDFHIGTMKHHEIAAQNGDLHNGSNDYEEGEEIEISNRGKVTDLLLPVIFLIGSCITGMIYTGGFFEGVSFIESFTNCDASRGLVLGSFMTLVFIFVLYIPRKIISYDDFTKCIPIGFKTMVPAMIILTLAWSLGNLVSDQLQAGTFVYNMMENANISTAILPSCLFIVAIGLAFATGTSWGTFGILIPIATSIFPDGSQMLVITIASILAGAVCGDHISPISDTTIMASAGAQCNHVNHVTSQIPYALLVAGACIIGYIIAGITENVVITFVSAVISLFIIIFIAKYFYHNRLKNERN